MLTVADHGNRGAGPFCQYHDLLQIRIGLSPMEQRAIPARRLNLQSTGLTVVLISG
jgi:hypothetical protein